MYVGGSKPSSDAGYFENLTRCIFQAGLNWKVIDEKWPGFRKAFRDFDVGKVASFGEADVERLMNDKGIVRNRWKIEATISNAGEFGRIAEEHGDFRSWLDSFDNYSLAKKQLAARFKHVGEGTAHIFLFSVGEGIEPNDACRQYEHRS
jgi:DNA-3-methyladenine glycosylase I